MIKKILFLFAFFLVLFLFVYNVNAKGAGSGSTSGPESFDPGKEITDNLPFEMAGMNCGVPNSKANACCSTRGLMTGIEEKELDKLISDLTDGKHKNLDNSLTQDQKQLLENLLDMTYLIDDEFDRIAALVIPTFILDKIDKGVKISNLEKESLTSFLRSQAVKLNNITAKELLLIQVRKTYTPDKCLIDTGIGNALCARGMNEFFAKILGNNPNFQSIFKSTQDHSTEKCVYGNAKETESSCICEANEEAVLCNDYLSNADEYGKCADCMTSKKGVWTGIGCVRTGSAAVFIQDVFLGWGIGLAGLIALICIIYSAFLLQTSQGNPERLKKAREYLTNCIIGFLIIIFAIFILRLVGVNILQIPGFGG